MCMHQQHKNVHAPTAQNRPIYEKPQPNEHLGMVSSKPGGVCVCVGGGGLQLGTVARQSFLCSFTYADRFCAVGICIHLIVFVPFHNVHVCPL